MHDIALFEIDRSYHQVQGRWHAEDDFERTGYSEKRHTETLRVIAPNEDLARAAVDHSNRACFSKEQDVRIDAVRRIELHTMITQSW